MLRVLLAISLLSGIASQAFGFDTCVPPELKVASIHGKVIRTYSKGEEPLKGATITVRKGESTGAIVAKATADAEGNFTFRKIPRGKYSLVVERNLFITFIFRVQVDKASKTPTPDAITINLGVDHNASCGGGYAEIRGRQQ